MSTLFGKAEPCRQLGPFQRTRRVGAQFMKARVITKTVKSSAIVMASLWVGVLFCLSGIVAPYLFFLAGRNSAAIPNSGVAAQLIGPLLYCSDVLGLAVGSNLLAALVFLRQRDELPLGGKLFLPEAGVGLAIFCAAINYWVLTPRLQALRGQIAERYGAFSQVDKADPLFKQFSGLHQTSTTLFLLGLAAAFICLVCLTHFDSRASDPHAALG